MSHLLAMRIHSVLPLLPFLAVFCAAVVFGETSPAPSAAKTGIEGVITISPIQGGPIRQGVPFSKPLPNTTFVVRKGTEEVARFTTDAEGKYNAALAPGHYEVMARETRKIGRWGPFPVEVVAGKMTKKDFDCDSGLR